MDAKGALIQSLVDGGYLKTPEIIEAFRAIDRADFVLPEYKDKAYGNYPLPIGSGQTISQPLTVAFLLELLQPQKGEKILDVGSGSGWTSALLAEIVGEEGKVLSVERIPELCEFGQKNLQKYDFLKEGRVQTFCQDASQGLPREAPFDKILAGAAAGLKTGRAALESIPLAWREQLKIGGKIVAPIGGLSAQAGSVWLFVKKSDKEFAEKEFPGFAFVPLIKDKNEENKKFYFLILLPFLFAAGVLANEIYIPHSKTEELKQIEINPGLGSREIAQRLKDEGVIRSKWTFVFYVSAKGAADNLKPGTYAFGPKTIPDITRELVKGANYERTMTIPEGWNLREINSYLQAQEFVFAADFERTAKNKETVNKFAEQFPFLAEIPAALGLEGYLFPDTYRVFQNSAAEEVLIKMLENFDKKLTPDLRQEIHKQKKTTFEIITMASLIEKEVISEEDRAMVSGILWKRLDKNIGLQVDATIAFITGRKTTKISQKEIQIDSPYNTYKYRGLPLGPITNPGLSAIKAAIYPKKSPYLYYLSAKDGRTIFSETLEEHNIAKEKYLR